MSENNKDNKNFEFIKEQVIEKKRKKLKKKLFPILKTICLALLFGIIAAFTFAVAEPKLYQFLNKEVDAKTPVNFPTISPEAESSGSDGNLATGTNSNSTATNANNTANNTSGTSNGTTQAITNTVIKKIDASLEDYTAMYDEINGVVREVDKSLVNVACTFTVEDWFGTSEKVINTTGVIVASNTSEYLILVSLDRVMDANSIRIKFSDITYVDAVIQDYESELNIALLALTIKDIPQLYSKGLEVAELGESYGVTVGCPIIAVGNPNGHIGSMDVGIVTSKGNYAIITDNKLELFNTSLQENENSDGVILNFDGDIIGFITRTLKDDLSEGLSTVIGITKIKPVIIQMGIQEPRIYFGIKADDMSEDIKKQHKITNGIYVNEVQADSPAFIAGLREGDFILYVNDQAILNTNNFYNIIATYKPGEKIIVKTLRTSGNSDKEMDISVTLKEKLQ